MEGEGCEDSPLGGGGDGAGACSQQLEELGLEGADTGEQVGAQGRSRVEVEAGAGGRDDDAAGEELGQEFGGRVHMVTFSSGEGSEGGGSSGPGSGRRGPPFGEGGQVCGWPASAAGGSVGGRDQSQTLPVPK